MAELHQRMRKVKIQGEPKKIWVCEDCIDVLPSNPYNWKTVETAWEHKCDICGQIVRYEPYVCDDMAELGR